MPSRQQIVAQARTYLNVPFVHQGRSRHHGVDCVGLATCVAYDLGMKDVRVTNYTMQVDENVFRAGLEEHLIRIQYPQLQIADLLTFRFKVEQHLAIVTVLDPITIIHAYLDVGRVVEHVLDDTWLKRLRGCYRFPGVEE